MTRADYRRAQREQRKANVRYNLGIKDIEAIKKQAAREAMELAFVCMLAMPCLTLHDQFGFGKKRLTRFMDSVMLKYECFEEDQNAPIPEHEKFNFDTMIKLVKKETGYDILQILMRKELIDNG